jgi:hypothetical protein
VYRVSRRDDYRTGIVNVGVALVAVYVLLKPSASLAGRIAATLTLAVLIWSTWVTIRRRVVVTSDGLTVVAWRTRYVRWEELQRVELRDGGRLLRARIAGDRFWRVLLVGRIRAGPQDEIQALATALAAMWSGQIAGTP